MSQECKIELLWPDSILHPNARVHWAKLSSAKAKARNDARLLTLAAGARGLKWAGVYANIIFHAPDNRRRDIDGMLSAMKAQIDGVAETIGVDDFNWTLFMERGEPVKGGRVVLLIKERRAAGLETTFAGAEPGKETA